MTKSFNLVLAALALMASASALARAPYFVCEANRVGSHPSFNEQIVSGEVFQMTSDADQFRIRMFNDRGDQLDTAVCQVKRFGKVNCFDRDERTLQWDVPAFMGSGFDLEAQSFSLELIETRDGSDTFGSRLRFDCHRE